MTRRPAFRPRVVAGSRRGAARRRTAGWPGGWIGIAASCLAVFGATVGLGLAWPAGDHAATEQPTLTAAPLTARSAGSAPTARVQRVVDGDTLVLSNGERVRILNIDTPEMPPRAACAAEAERALAAKARLESMIEGRVVALFAGARDRDPYGRLLRRIEADGRDVGERLIAERLAQRWRGRKAEWC